MPARQLGLVLVVAFAMCPGAATAAADTPAVPPAKQAAVDAVDAQREALIGLADQIWAFAETALREEQSAEVLARYAESEGFAVERGVAGLPTGFVAEYGHGAPVIAILGEYDALPGLSQRARPERMPLEEGAAGHGCGHNLFGPGSLGAAVAIKRLIDAGALTGTIRFYGTPAEEAVGGKLFMIRAGLFDDVDIALAWHPSDETRADTASSQSMVDFAVTFRGRSAHAAFDPWNGRSALDGLEIFTFALNQMREHVPPTARMHYAIVDGGDVPNVVPEHARLWCWLRDRDHHGVAKLLERARKIAEGAAIAAGVEAELHVQSGLYEMLPNVTGARLLHDNLSWLGPIPFDDADEAFAKELQRATGVPPSGLRRAPEPWRENPDTTQGGSTDVADVSWVVPTLHLTVTTAPAGTPWHAWPVVAAGGMSIGHEGMLHAAKTLAATMVDLFSRPAARRAIRKEWETKTDGFVYRTFLPDGPPPIPAR